MTPTKIIVSALNPRCNATAERLLLIHPSELCKVSQGTVTAPPVAEFLVQLNDVSDMRWLDVSCYRGLDCFIMDTL